MSAPSRLELRENWLRQNGHTPNKGVCEKCWSDAALVYASDPSFKDQQSAYKAVLARALEQADLAIARTAAP